MSIIGTAGIAGSILGAIAAYNKKVKDEEEKKFQKANDSIKIDAFQRLPDAGKVNDYNTNFTDSDTYKNMKNSLSGVYAAANPIDLSGIIADYKKNNQANIDTLNKTLSDTINTLKTSSEQTRNDLLTSLKRFQESNAENMRIQQQDFNASRASLEDEAFMNQRNSLANAASRGLGGSGLQQLAQLQNRLAAGKNISSLAQKNQNAQDALRRALAQQTEDTDTKVNNLETNLRNAIIEAQDKTAAEVNKSNTNTTNLINNLIYNEEVRQRNAKAQAASANASLASLVNSMNSGVNLLKGAEKTFDKELENKVSEYLEEKGKTQINRLSSSELEGLSRELSTLYNEYVSNNINVAAKYNLDQSYTDTALSNLRNIYNKYRIF